MPTVSSLLCLHLGVCPCQEWYRLGTGPSTGDRLQSTGQSTGAHGFLLPPRSTESSDSVLEEPRMASRSQRRTALDDTGWPGPLAPPRAASQHLQDAEDTGALRRPDQAPTLFSET